VQSFRASRTSRFVEVAIKRQLMLLWIRNNRINEFMDWTGGCIIKHCIASKIGHIQIGELKLTKNGINHG
jgi:hypothetical protein